MTIDAAPKFHTRIMTLASRLWISDMAVAVIADTAKPAVSVAKTGRNGAEGAVRGVVGIEGGVVSGC